MPFVAVQLAAARGVTVDPASLARTPTALAAQVGELHPASYVVVEEIAADGWGYGGRMQAARRDAATAAAR